MEHEVWDESVLVKAHSSLTVEQCAIFSTGEYILRIEVRYSCLSCLNYLNILFILKIMPSNSFRQNSEGHTKLLPFVHK